MFLRHYRLPIVVLVTLVLGTVPASAERFAQSNASTPPAPPTASAPASAAIPTAAPATSTPATPLPPDVADRLHELLKTRHKAPPRSEFEALGVAAITPTLHRMSRDATLFPLYRYRALEALGHWPEDDVFRLYVEVLASVSGDEPWEHDMLTLIVGVFGVRSIPVGTPYLDDPRLAIRLTVLRALANVEDPKARAILVDRSLHDPAEAVRERAKRWIQPSPTR